MFTGLYIPITRGNSSISFPEKVQPKHLYCFFCFSGFHLSLELIER